MTVNIQDKEVKLKYSFRALMIFENITKRSFNPQTVSDIVIFFYSVVLGSNRNINIEFDDFIDYLDENPEKMNEFSEWLTSVLNKNKEIQPEVSEKDIKKSKNDSEKN